MSRHPKPRAISGTMQRMSDASAVRIGQRNRTVATSTMRFHGPPGRSMSGAGETSHIRQVAPAAANRITLNRQSHHLRVICYMVGSHRRVGKQTRRLGRPRMCSRPFCSSAGFVTLPGAKKEKRKRMPAFPSFPSECDPVPESESGGCNSKSIPGLPPFPPRARRRPTNAPLARSGWDSISLVVRRPPPPSPGAGRLKRTRYGLSIRARRLRARFLLQHLSQIAVFAPGRLQIEQQVLD